MEAKIDPYKIYQWINKWRYCSKYWRCTDCGRNSGKIKNIRHSKECKHRLQTI